MMGLVDRKRLKTAIAHGLEPKDESIIELTRQYWHFVQALDEATKELEEMAQRLTRQADLSARKANEQTAEAEELTQAVRQAVAAPEDNGHYQPPEDDANRRPPDEPHYTSAEAGRRRASLVRRFKLPASLLSKKMECDPSVDSQLERLEEQDVKISLFQYHLEVLERRILETQPQDSDNALKKMKFIASLIIDGHDLDVDYFAYLIQECAEACEEQLEQIFQVYREHVQKAPAFR
ncbi:hypothetical protein [Rhodosalinus sediminis]|uniref:hypothetical protein n=1 Tax=Rhodosalinus sediminis TaxID=1940533 RepID=UPI002354B397|nr:hypothetical protein [Rhodosalinus sediminis]